MADEPTSTDHAMILGELRGQMRELVHSLNNLSGKFDGLSAKVIQHGTVVDKVAQLEIAVAGLKADRDRREGAAGILATIMRSPALGWLVGTAVTAWALLSGRVAP